MRLLTGRRNKHGASLSGFSSSHCNNLSIPHSPAHGSACKPLSCRLRHRCRHTYGKAISLTCAYTHAEALAHTETYSPAYPDTLAHRKHVSSVKGLCDRLGSRASSARKQR